MFNLISNVVGIYSRNITVKHIDEIDQNKILPDSELFGAGPDKVPDGCMPTLSVVFRSLE